MKQRPVLAASIIMSKFRPPQNYHGLFSGVWRRDANSLLHFWRTSVVVADPRPVTGLSSTFGPYTLTGRHGPMSPCPAHNTIVLFTYIRTDVKGVWKIETH